MIKKDSFTLAEIKIHLETLNDTFMFMKIKMSIYKNQGWKCL